MIEHRPWGNFEQFTTNEETTVKILTINPGQRLSLQRHEHRSEEWIVIEGVVSASIDGVSYGLYKGNSVNVPRGAEHRLWNSRLDPARVLEIARGHFDEDDIVRLEDDYGRDV